MCNQMIICGFSGIGKSTAAQKSRLVLDFESSGWSHLHTDGEERPLNPAFPMNYINKLRELIAYDEARYYLLSCHQEVRAELQRQHIPYIIVAPKRECKNAYLKRWLKRGSAAKFIKSMSDKWDEMIDSCEKDPAPVIWLDEHEYISDLLCC